MKKKIINSKRRLDKKKISHCEYNSQMFYGYWKRLDELIIKESFKDPYDGMRIAYIKL